MQKYGNSNVLHFSNNLPARSVQLLIQGQHTSSEDLGTCLDLQSLFSLCHLLLDLLSFTLAV